MQALWKLDQDAFRAVQYLRMPWLDPVLQGVTCTGLGWVQVLLVAILFIDWRKRRTISAPFMIGVLFAIFVAIVSQFVESYHTVGLGIGIVLLALAAVFVLIEVVATRALTETRFSLALPLLTAYAVSGTVNTILKQSIPRDRPSLLSWVHALEDVRYHSFSSGHTATAVGIAACLFWLTRGTSFAAWGRWGCAWACLVGFSRMYVGVHWPSDVLSGGSVGVLAGTWVAWLFMRNRSNLAEPSNRILAEAPPIAD